MAMDNNASYMPAEWEPHEACLILYPHNSDTFRLPQAQKEFQNLIRTILVSGQERVWLGCVSETVVKAVQEEFNDDMLTCFVIGSNDTWVRDTGPTFVVTKNRTMRVGLDWQFNAYGGPDDGCYWPCDLDQALARNICSHFNLQCQSVKDLILEGGSIHTDGEGTILTTKECLLHKNRNPGLSQATIERCILQATGCSHMIWLDTGVAYDDDTNGHVDNFCCFVQPAVVALAWTDDETRDPENYQRCRQALSILETAVDARGRSLTVHKLLLPSPPLAYTRQEVEDLTKQQAQSTSNDSTAVDRVAGQRLAASYVNFYIANQAVIVPQFGCTDTDEAAVKKLQELFPTRTAVGVYSRDILVGGGNIHCVTQQVPSVQEKNS